VPVVEPTDRYDISDIVWNKSALLKFFCLSGDYSQSYIDEGQSYLIWNSTV